MMEHWIPIFNTIAAPDFNLKSQLKIERREMIQRRYFDDRCVKIAMYM